MPTLDAELTVSLGEAQPGKEDPTPLCREDGGIG